MQMLHAVNTVILTLIFLISGCSVKVHIDEMWGRYKLKYPYGSEELLLNKDGTYVQTVFINGEATPKVNTGKWEFDENHSRVILVNAMIVDDYFGHLRPSYWEIKPGLSIFRVKKSFGRIKLIINPDQGFFFEKII